VSRRLRLLAVTPLLALTLAACSSSDLTADDVAQGAEDALEAEVGARPDISCPDDLPAEVGATTRCTLSAGGDPQKYGVTVTVTQVDGTTAHFDVKVDKTPAQ
jgi:hypothetical protein